MKYHYNTLSETHKAIYRQVLDGLENLSETILITCINIEEMNNIFHCIRLDNPQIFYTHVTEPFKLDTSGLLTPQYLYDKETIKHYQDLINNILATFDTIKDYTAIEKERFVHDYCLNYFSYNNAECPEPEAYSIIGLLTKQSAVCQGIALFVKLFFDYQNIPSLVVTGDCYNHSKNIKEPHAWNIVLIDGKYYHLDVTWDITFKHNNNRYDYFNLSDNAIKIDHSIKCESPTCNSEDKDYYSLHNMVASSFTEIENIIINQLKDGNRSAVVKLANLDIFKRSRKNLSDMLSKIAYGVLDKSCLYKGFQTFDNNAQLVFEFEFCDIG